MKRYIGVLIISVITLPLLAEDASPLKTEKDKVSYSLGFSIGKGLILQGVDVDWDQLALGLKDAVSGSQTLLTEQEMQDLLKNLQKQVMTQRQEKAQAESEKNKTEGEAFLTENKQKEGVVTLPSGLQYKVIKPGSGQKPNLTDTVVTNYRGTFINGTEFDSSESNGGPATFPVNGVIKGWTEALQLMELGAKWQLFVPPELAYGEQGASDVIGPNTTLLFEVELLEIKPASENKN